MGEDTLYSGTVAAATEGYLFGIPAIAFSLTEKGWEHIDGAARIARTIGEQQTQNPLGSPVLLNVNIPAVPFETIPELRVTRLGTRTPPEPVVISTTPYGSPVTWSGPVARARKDGGGGRKGDD